MTNIAGSSARLATSWLGDSQRPFAKLALTHALMLAGDALLALALVGSLFFDVDPSEGRQNVLVGLLFTMAPFALIGPLIGPMIDRAWGGHRAVIVVSGALRSVLGMAMVWAIYADSWTLFPLAFLMLVLSKTYQVARAAVVPAVVDSDDELVEANSKLQVLGGIAGFIAVLPGALLFLLDTAYVAGACALVFAFAAVAALGIPPTRVATEQPDETEIAELRSRGVVLAATTMATVRGVVGFVTLLIAFELRGGPDLPNVEVLARNVARNLQTLQLNLQVIPIEAPPEWYFAVVVPLTVLGGLVGAALAPRLRDLMPEERILLGALLATAVAGVAGVVLDGLLSYIALGALVALGASAGKQAFDAVVQRDAPDANRGRSFARFEARFQVVWVGGALIPTALRIPVTLGAALVVIVSVVGAAFYATGGQLGSRLSNQVSRLGKSGMSGGSSSSGNG